jgi:hypothetical protein
MEVLIVDWAYLKTVPAGQREDLVEEAAFGPDDVYDYNPRRGGHGPTPRRPGGGRATSSSTP